MQGTYLVCAALADTFGDDFIEALLVARVSAVFALHTCSLEKEFLTEGAQNNAVELLLYEFVTILLHYILLALPDSRLTLQACCIQRTIAEI